MTDKREELVQMMNDNWSRSFNRLQGLVGRDFVRTMQTSTSYTIIPDTQPDEKYSKPEVESICVELNKGDEIMIPFRMGDCSDPSFVLDPICNRIISSLRMRVVNSFESKDINFNLDGSYRNLIGAFNDCKAQHNLAYNEEPTTILLNPVHISDMCNNPQICKHFGLAPHETTKRHQVIEFFLTELGLKVVVESGSMMDASGARYVLDNPKLLRSLNILSYNDNLISFVAFQDDEEDVFMAKMCAKVLPTKVTNIIYK